MNNHYIKILYPVQDNDLGTHEVREDLVLVKADSRDIAMMAVLKTYPDAFSYRYWTPKSRVPDKYLAAELAITDLSHLFGR